MKPKDVKELYDAAYAASFNDKFITSKLAARDAEFELKLLEDLLKGDPEWLDVACGTGYFLSHFPAIRRTGCDISGAMLDRARAADSSIVLIEHDMREPQLSWNDRFGLVSCMWFAYTLVDTMAEFDQVVANLAAWTSPAGTCFMPICDPWQISGVDIPYRAETIFPGTVNITGILWNYVEDNGAKRHTHLVTPQLDYIAQQFGRHFENIEIVRYHQPRQGDGLFRYFRRDDSRNNRPALIATKKRTRDGSR